MEGKWEFERNIGTGGFGLVKLFTNQVWSVHFVFMRIILMMGMHMYVYYVQ